MRIGLGFDTGGTYTDAVIMDLDETRILCKAKSPTTREDLCIGIRGALAALDQDLLKDVGVVSLSSTLATNSVVEGKGARVALVSIGYDYDGSCPVDFTVTVAGGHKLRGEEAAPLDEEAVRRFLESVRGRVDGVAIAGYLAVRNPDHENRVRDMAEEILGLPTVCGHDLSSGLGFSERAATCVMNARLIPVVCDLIESVKKVLSEHGISAPLMMVRGDGSMMGEEEARHRPVETIMSGPAASLIGAMVLSGKRDAIVMDMGGTTTDIGILRDGKPRLEPEGAILGGIRTRVLAAEISTSGIGGDSRIVVANGKPVQTALRVMPLCFAVQRWPRIKTSLEALSAVKPPSSSTQDADSVVLESEFLRTLRKPADTRDFSPTDLAVLDTLAEEPKTIREIAEAVGVHPYMLNVRRLESLGFVQRIGFTPTDMLHALGELSQFDAEASKAAADYLARAARVPVDGFLATCREMIREKLCTELLKELVSEEIGSTAFGPAGEDLLRKAIAGTPGRDYGCSIRVGKPIIGIGAPVSSYIPAVGETFGAEVVINPDSDVGNAIGAISSSISESISVLIRPAFIGAEEGFTAFSKLGKTEFTTLDEAVTASVATATAAVTEEVRRSGAGNVTVTVDRRDKEFDYGDTGNRTLLEVELTVTAAGRPEQFLAS
ncbi:MAG: hydantoinase/oxoprolinase family protein [Thermoplasmata archaeon]|nr:hydantoinase/oxoprolinase family protein [Thermoplasmata archaeon]